MMVRMLAPVKVGNQTCKTPSGRTYTAAPGAYLDVVDFDALTLEANGWVRVANSGTTAQRPSPYQGNAPQMYLDTTLGKLVFHDGNTWRDPVTGNAV